MARERALLEEKKAKKWLGFYLKIPEKIVAKIANNLKSNHFEKKKKKNVAIVMSSGFS